MVSLLAFGDSHLETLRFAAELGLLDAAESHFCIVPGATAVGLRNPNSVTNALSMFREFAAPQSRLSRVLIHLGEVDCGFVVWWRQLKYGEPVEVAVQESLSAYRGFVLELQGMGFKCICITGASLPTIRDGVDFGEIANLRSEVRVSLEERTKLTFYYNSQLRHLAKELSCAYFEISEGILSRKEEIVSDYFRNQDPSDHHLDKSKVVGIWALACNNFLRTKFA